MGGGGAGRVVAADGTPVEGAHGGVTKEDGGATGTSTDEQGAFDVDPLGPGARVRVAVTLDARDPYDPSFAQEGVDVLTPARDVVLRLPPGPSVEVRVVATHTRGTGAPLPNGVG